MSLGTWIWSGVAAASAYRALVRPVRAVYAAGEITDCPASGPGCEPVLRVRSTDGPSPVYSVVSGVVSRVVPGSVVELISSHEPVVVSYLGPMVLNAAGVQIAAGQPVRLGQVLGQAGSIGVAVSQLTRLAGGSLALKPLEPASWLAARGLRAATRLTSGLQWCQGGRALVVPQEVVRCGMRLPEPASFSLLPITVRLA